MNEDIRVSISEAARLFGVSVKTIRQAIKEGQIVYIVVNGRYKLNFKSLILWSQQSTRRRNILAKQGIGRYVDKWNIKNPKYSPRPPKEIRKSDHNDHLSDKIEYVPTKEDEPRD